MAGIGSTVGIASTADIYGPSAGATFAQAVEHAPTTAQSLQSTASDSATIEQKNLLPGLGKVNPLLWVPVLILAIFGIKLLREWGTKRDDFKVVRVDLYWWLTTTLGAAAGIPLLKGFLNKYKVPGLTEYINNA